MAFPRAHIRLYLADGAWIGPGKAALLAHIQDTGSISAAGRRMGMSYKRAWTLVESLNTMFATPLVQSARGGAAGGGAALTEAGEQVLTAYRDLVAATEDAGASAMARLAALRDMSDGK